MHSLSLPIKVLSAVVIITCTLQLTACTSLGKHRRYSSRDGAPLMDIDVSKVPNAVPKPEPYSKYGNPKSYVTNGQRYSILKSHLGYDEKGIASWYGTLFHGHRTSSGEPYNLYTMTAAHKTLPIPCYAKVTNLKNGREIIVKINDRGPFHENRIIDLSYVAAKKLGVFPAGTALVEVQTIDASQPLPSIAGRTLVATAPVAGTPHLYLQIGAFAVRDNADRLAKEIAHYTQDGIQIKTAELNQQPIYKVLIGPIANVDSSDALHDELRKAKLGTPITVILEH